MHRLLAVSALALVLAAPAYSQSATSDSMSSQTGRETLDSPQAGQVPTDCQPNDIRPECQTAQLPELEEDVYPPERDRLSPEAPDTGETSEVPDRTPDQPVEEPTGTEDPRSSE